MPYVAKTLGNKLSKKSKDQALMPQILRMLEAQSRDSLEHARKRLSMIGVKDEIACASIEFYASNWNDFIHPSILSLSFDAVSKRSPIITDLQVMVLFLTAAMDIHDDVMDMSRKKNGKLTLYGKFGKDLAILVGDAILMESLLMLSSLRKSIDDKSYNRIVKVVKSTLLEVGNAHLMELQLKTKTNIMPQEILDLIEKKAAIFEGISEIGAVAGKGSNGQIYALKTSARSFGYLVMLREEFIDMFEPVELSSRLKNEYPPLPIILSMDDPRIGEYVRTYKSAGITKKSVQELIEWVAINEKVINLKKEMNDRVSQAILLLEQYELKKEPASSLANLIKVTLEDL
jgi:geranylgeranyl pyrophosphate synthase